MKNTLLTILLFFIIGTEISWAQKPKFGHVNRKELSEKKFVQDTSVNARILYYERIAYFDFSTNEGLVLKEDHYMRIKIYNKSGYDYATHSIPLYHDSHTKERIMRLKAFTYNLINGKIVKNKLSKKNIFNEKTNNHYNQVKFTMPNIKPGSIVEWKYTFVTPFAETMNPFVIQRDIPVKQVYFKIKVPEFLGYRPIIKGYLPVQIKKSTNSRSMTFYSNVRTGGVGFTPVEHSTKRTEISFTETVYEINKTNIPALKDEPLSGNIDNYRSAILMELYYLDYPGEPRKMLAVTWEDVAKETFKESKFGGQLKKKNYLKTDLKHLANLKDEEKITAVLEFAKKKVKWNKEYGYRTQKGVVKAYKTGTGNVADVNLNLINMLNVVGLEATPVLVSTVSNGIPIFPTRSGFNYVIAAVKMNNKWILLDATEKNSIPNVLPERTLNFQGRLIHNDGSSEAIELFPNFFSSKLRNVSVKLNDDNEIEGLLFNRYDNYFAMKNRIKLQNKRADEIKQWFQNHYDDLDIVQSQIKNLDNPYQNIKEKVQFETDNFVENIEGKIYITPLLTWRFENNPFKSKERKFPVFFKFPHILSSTINWTIPDKYEIEQIPENANYTFGDKIGSFDYQILKNGNKLNIKSNFIINYSVIPEEDYQALKEFMDKVISKQNEKIVLREK